jgi:hypothetical protein
MAAIDFPPNAQVDDIFVAGLRSWKYDGYAWRILSANTGPAGPTGPQGSPGATGPTGPAASTGKMIAMAMIFGG